jgi:ubiquinone/menaquinone biosynthesis C-methylase UbiE
MSVEQWETYYRGGGLVTCPTGPDANYTLEARDVWVEFFALLPEGARIVDIGTGNGPIPLIAKDVAAVAGRRFEIHGVDLAQIAPHRDVADGARLFEGIRFHPGTSAEQLPFESASVIAVTGQYALEYTNVPRVLAEVSRVLAPGGWAQFITHSRDSIVLQNAAPTFRQFQILFEQTRLLRKLRRFLEVERESRERARAAARDLEAAMREVESALSTTSFGQPALAMALDTTRQVLAARRATPLTQLEARIDAVERELKGSLRRLQDLTRCALDVDDVARYSQFASGAGLHPGQPVPLLHAGQNIIGWRLNFRKPATPTA